MKSLKAIASVLMCLFNLVQIRGQGTVEVTYEELQELNVTCPPFDTCSQADKRYSESLTTNECNCDKFCARYDTCCVDSPYKHMPKPSTKPTCRRVSEWTGYFMIDQCPQSGDSQSAYEDLCRAEWDGENDIMRLVPVTSLFTHITYKNFFCFRCHEANDDFVFWNIQTEYQGQSPVYENTHMQLEYDRDRNSWLAPVGQRGALIPVSFPVFTIPLDIHSAPMACILDVISECSEYWEDDVIRAKCADYMDLTNIYKGDMQRKYRNPHCAICNFEDLNEFGCKRPVAAAFGGAKKPFSFTLLLDINQSDGDKVGKIQKCDRNSVWDPFFKKCRPLQCALPGYVVKDGQCTAS